MLVTRVLSTRQRKISRETDSAEHFRSCADCTAAVACHQRKPDHNEKVREQLVELAQQRPRFGYRRLGILLSREGQHINHKRPLSEGVDPTPEEA